MQKLTDLSVSLKETKIVSGARMANSSSACKRMTLPDICIEYIVANAMQREMQRNPNRAAAIIVAWYGIRR